MTQRLIMLPTDIGFYDILNSSVPVATGENQTSVIPDSETGLFKRVDARAALEYGLGGEYDAYLEEFGEDDDELESIEENYNLAPNYDASSDLLRLERSISWFQSPKPELRQTMETGWVSVPDCE